MKTKVFRKAYMRGRYHQSFERMGVVPERVWGSEALGMAPAPTEVVRRQLASAPGKKLLVWLSLFVEINNLSGSRAWAGMCGYVFLDASTLDWNVGRMV